MSRSAYPPQSLLIVLANISECVSPTHSSNYGQPIKLYLLVVVGSKCIAFLYNGKMMY